MVTMADIPHQASCSMREQCNHEIHRASGQDLICASWLEKAADCPYY
jgi:hypothetical protein